MPSIQVPSALRSFTGGASQVEVAATTVRDAIAELDRRHPGIAAKILDRGAVKPFIRIFVGPEDIGGLSGMETQLAERDELAIVPAIAGGRDVSAAPGGPEGCAGPEGPEGCKGCDGCAGPEVDRA